MDKHTVVVSNGLSNSEVEEYIEDFCYRVLGLYVYNQISLLIDRTLDVKCSENISQFTQVTVFISVIA